LNQERKQEPKFFRIFVVLLASIVFFVPTTSAQPSGSLQDRPAEQGKPTQIHVAVYVVDVREIDGSKQSFSADVFLRLRWKDSRLASGGVRIVPANDVWTPRIQIGNRITVQTTLPEVLEIDQTGAVTYRQRFIGQFSCMLDLREFPFDRQTIPFRLVSTGLSPDQIEFIIDRDSGLASKFALTDWKVTSWHAKAEPYQVAPAGRSLAAFTFEFYAQRYFHFFLVQIIIPMTLILGMSWIVFWLDPAQPGPRVSISITSMLTIVAYRLLLGNFLPRLSFLTRMDYFVFGCTFLVFLSLVTVVTISRMFFNKRESIATRLDRHARWIFPSLFIAVLLTAFAG